MGNTKEQLLLPMEGWTRQDPAFFAEKMLEGLDAEIEQDARINSIVSRYSKYESPSWLSAKDEAKNRGCALVPANVFDQVRYKMLVKGYGSTAEAMSPDNDLWDDVYENDPVDGLIEQIDGPDSGYQLAVGAYVVSLGALSKILIRDYRNGEGYREANVQVNYYEEEQ